LLGSVFFCSNASYIVLFLGRTFRGGAPRLPLFPDKATTSFSRRRGRAPRRALLPADPPFVEDPAPSRPARTRPIFFFQRNRCDQLAFFLSTFSYEVLFSSKRDPLLVGDRPPLLPSLFIVPGYRPPPLFSPREDEPVAFLLP